MNYNETDQYFDTLYNNLALLADRVLSEMNQASITTIEKTYSDFGAYQRERIQQIFDSAVSSFYNSYSPSQYNRTYGLYDVLDISYDRYGRVMYEDVKDLLDPSKMHTDRKGGDLFNKVFMEGWHGGAEAIYSNEEIWGSHPSSSGVPYYRKPGLITLPNGTKVWHRWGRWGRKSVRTIAPAVTMYNELLLAERGDMHSKLLEIVTRYNNEAMDKIHREVIPRLRKEIFNN